MFDLATLNILCYIYFGLLLSVRILNTTNNAGKGLVDLLIDKRISSQVLYGIYSPFFKANTVSIIIRRSAFF